MGSVLSTACRPSSQGTRPSLSGQLVRPVSGPGGKNRLFVPSHNSRLPRHDLRRNGLQRPGPSRGCLVLHSTGWGSSASPRAGRRRACRETSPQEERAGCGRSGPAFLGDSRRRHASLTPALSRPPGRRGPGPPDRWAAQFPQLPAGWPSREVTPLPWLPPDARPTEGHVAHHPPGRANRPDSLPAAQPAPPGGRHLGRTDGRPGRCPRSPAPMVRP
jgi:hypothetical protein